MSVLEVQMITDIRFLIPETQGEVTVFGRILRIGPNELGKKFPYRSPLEQIRVYGQQHYVLVNAEDDEGNAIEHPDLMVRLDENGQRVPFNPIPESKAEVEPVGVLPSSVKRGWGNDQIDGPVHQVTTRIEETEEAPKAKRKKRRSRRKKVAS